MLYRIDIERESRDDGVLEVYIDSPCLSLITNKVIEKVCEEVLDCEIEIEYCKVAISEHCPPSPNAIIHSHDNIELLIDSKSK